MLIFHIDLFNLLCWRIYKSQIELLKVPIICILRLESQAKEMLYQISSAVPIKLGEYFSQYPPNVLRS